MLFNMIKKEKKVSKTENQISVKEIYPNPEITTRVLIFNFLCQTGWTVQFVKKV